ncbi:uncharacterized protein J4E78_008993 [Alternaria triticimaculans]|uniref:uncharacterized protein n=1 Tax=Alternaria triticimaculans TaxID=297637 RepID=UPI0020C4B73F|nr:uncharacterized protein J4E78_008993 [Alternaria triticimaculans]KAI4647021.1 hypothetical protein J4E78_008993 [Alternaria triticimaculans]
MSWNVEKSIELHNQIVAHALSHLPPGHQPNVERDWFATHRLDPASTKSEFDLDDDLVEFLSDVKIVAPEYNGHLLDFCPVLVGVVNPRGDHGLRPQSWEGSRDHAGLISLYHNEGPYPGGLVYSLDTRQVTYLKDASTSPFEPELPWANLNDVLQLYWNCIESGKFVIDAGNFFGYSNPGWRIEHCTEKEMDQMLDVWGSLVDLIAKKMPASGTHGRRNNAQDKMEDEGPRRKKRRTQEVGLVSTEVLNMYPAIPPFVRAFLSRAKKPPFKSIAPQLDVPDEAFVHRIGAQMQKKDPQATLIESQTEVIGERLFLLFPWRTQGMPLISECDQLRWEPTNRSGILDNRGGLYIHHNKFYSHCSTLLLPFPVGGNGHVLRGDDTKVEEPGQDVLYDLGLREPFLPDIGTPLIPILLNWWEQVENDSWAVDKNGVAGGGELWKKADTEQHAEDFQIEWGMRLADLY